MKKLTFVAMACVVFVLVGATGCQPKLAESPYGAKEQQWEEFIKDAFPDWEPPQTVPPARQAQTPASDVAPPNIIADDTETEIVTSGAEPTIDVKSVDVENVKTDDASTEFQSYTVQKGDTLWKIANRFYGSGTEWRKVFEANRDTLSNPDKLKAGAKIRIPAKQ
jgi:LysM repeat protein